MIPEGVAIGAFGVACAVALGFGFTLVWRPAAPAIAPAVHGARHLDVWLALLCLVTGALFYLPYTNDDSFIFFRYARNVAHGLGPVFNPGERVEGFTSPVWVVVLSASVAAGLDPLWMAKLLGLALAAMAVLVFHRAASLVYGRAVGFSCALGLVTLQLFLSWIGSGMDVAVFLLFECALIALFAREAPPGLALALTAVGVFVRPEASMLLGIYWLLAVVRAARARTLGGTLRYAAAALVLAVAPFGLRWFYYHDLLPNTYYAKSAATMRHGVGYILGLVRYLGVPIVAAAVAGAVMEARTRPWLLTCLAALTLYLIGVGGDILSLRFGLFVVPWVLLAGGACLARLPEPWRGTGLGLSALLLVAQSMFHMSTATSEHHSQVGHLYVINNARGTSETDARAGEYLARHARPGELLVTDNIGAVGYLGQLPVLDTYGLVSHEVAELVARRDTVGQAALIRVARAPWILCYFDQASDGEHWSIYGGGDITSWARGQYDPVEHWVASTGYARVLLRRRAG